MVPSANLSNRAYSQENCETTFISEGVQATPIFSVAYAQAFILWGGSARQTQREPTLWRVQRDILDFGSVLSLRSNTSLTP